MRLGVAQAGIEIGGGGGGEFGFPWGEERCWVGRQWLLWTCGLGWV